MCEKNTRSFENLSLGVGGVVHPRMRTSSYSNNSELQCEYCNPVSVLEDITKLDSRIRTGISNRKECELYGNTRTERYRCGVSKTISTVQNSCHAGEDELYGSLPMLHGSPCCNRSELVLKSHL